MEQFKYDPSKPKFYAGWGEELANTCDYLEAELEAFILDAARATTDYSLEFNNHVLEHWETYETIHFDKEELDLRRAEIPWYLFLPAWGIQLYAHIDADRENDLMNIAIEERENENQE